MKKIQKSRFQKKLRYFIWISGIFILLMMCNKNVVETRTTIDIYKDIYEEDDHPWQSWPIVVNTTSHQLHTFHNINDVDWVYFYGHAGNEYEIKAYPCDTFINLSLTDPNGKILTSETGNPIQTICYLPWLCKKDDYYCLKIEPSLELPEGGEYYLTIEYEQAASPASVLGRVVNTKGEGLNGLRVNFISSGKKYSTLTGSLQNVRRNNLDLLKINGWYFILNLVSGVYDLILTEDDPNIILKEAPSVLIESYQINKIKDIVIHYNGHEADAVSSFDLVYTQYQNEKVKNYPVWEDKDGDGSTNLDEFLGGTDPDDPNNTSRDIYIPGGWSMISIPLISVNTSITGLFNDAVVMYEYENGLGYKRVEKADDLKAKKGYWILLLEGKNYNLTGQPVQYHTLSLNKDGWNMIGGCTSPARSSTEGCHIDVIYGYKQEAGYEQIPSSECLEPGRGYWILLNGIVDKCKLRVEAN